MIYKVTYEVDNKNYEMPPSEIPVYLKETIVQKSEDDTIEVHIVLEIANDST